MLTDLKVVELYQNLRIRSMASFRILYMLTNLKAVFSLLSVLQPMMCRPLRSGGRVHLRLPELASKFEAVERDWDKDGEFDPLHSEVLAELNRENNADRR